MNDDQLFEAMKNARPAWMADNLGVRGNAVDFVKQQIPIDVPVSSVTRRGVNAADIYGTITNPLANNNQVPPNPQQPVIPTIPTTPSNPDPDPPLDPASSEADFVLSAIRGQDIGFPNNYGVFYEDQAFVYSDPSDSSPTFVTATQIPENSSIVVKGVEIWRTDKYYDNTHDAAFLRKQAHFDSTFGANAGPAFRIYATDFLPGH